MKPGQIKRKHTQLAGLMNQLIRMLFVKNTVVPKAVLFLIHFLSEQNMAAINIVKEKKVLYCIM